MLPLSLPFEMGGWSPAALEPLWGFTSWRANWGTRFSISDSALLRFIQLPTFPWNYAEHSKVDFTLLNDGIPHIPGESKKPHMLCSLTLPRRPPQPRELHCCSNQGLQRCGWKVRSTSTITWYRQRILAIKNRFIPTDEYRVFQKDGSSFWNTPYDPAEGKHTSKENYGHRPPKLGKQGKARQRGEQWNHYLLLLIFFIMFF